MTDLGAATWSETDASNTATPPAGWPEGMFPSDVNNSARANMGGEKRWWVRSNPVFTSAGSSTVYTLTYGVAAAAYYDGEAFEYVVDETCGAAPTLNINGLGARNLRKFVSGSWVNLAAGDIVANQVIRVRYNLGATAFDVIAITPSTLAAAVPGYLFNLNTSRSSTTVFGVAAGTATDSTGVASMTLATADTKSTSAWAVGSGNGSLDVGTVGNTLSYYPYLIQRPDTGVVDILTSLSPDRSAVVTMTIATPAVVTWTGEHGLQAGSAVVFTTTGALPTGVTAGTTYYVLSTSITTTTFRFAATQGGSAINTTGSQSGVHTGTSAPTMPANYTLRRRIGAFRTDGSAQIINYQQRGDRFTLDVPVADVNATNPGTSAVTVTLTSIPTGIIVDAWFDDKESNGTNNRFVLWTALDQTDTAPSVTLNNLNCTASASVVAFAGEFYRKTNAAAQVRYRTNASGVADSSIVTTLGWIDRRGQDG